MAGFKFRLEQVLRYRKQLEDQAKMAFAKAQTDLAVEVEKLVKLNNSLAEQKSLPYINNEEFWLRENFIRSLKEDIAEAELNKSRFELLVERRRHELIKASQERQLLDKLKEKQAERYLHEQYLKEQINLNEIATIRYKAEAV